MEVGAHTVDEEIVDLVTVALGYAGFFGGGSAADDDAFVLVWGEEVGDFTGVEDIVDVLKELFHNDLEMKIKCEPSY